MPGIKIIPLGPGPDQSQGLGIQGEDGAQSPAKGKKGAPVPGSHIKGEFYFYKMTHFSKMY